MKHVHLFNENQSLQETVKALDGGGIGFVAYIDTNGKLVGIVTDGDLRRSILKNANLLTEIINRNPETMHWKSNQRDVMLRLRHLHRRHMPLVDEQRVLKSVFSLDDVEFSTMPNYVVLMAGGLGTRLGELTKDTPKPMLSVGDRPMLQHIIELFSEQGFTKFIICVNYKKEVIQKYFGNGDKFGVSIDYVVEKTPLGTAGALGFLDRNKINTPFIVANADVLTTIDFVELLKFHSEKNATATMCVRQFQQQVSYGVVTADDSLQIKNIEEKPIFCFDINAGVYVLEPEVLNLIPLETHFDMPNLFLQMIAEKKHCSIFRIMDYWVDIGRKEDLLRANKDLNLGFSTSDEDDGEDK